MNGVNHVASNAADLTPPSSKLNFYEQYGTHLFQFNLSFLMLLRCIAFACIFIQFKSLKRINSKFLLCNIAFI